MSAIPVIAIFDIGKTNKKLFLFDEDYKIVHEETVCFAETTDEDGDACEDMDNLRSFAFSSLHKVFQNRAYEVKAVNFSAYGATFVHLNENGQPVTPIYNYLKAYPKQLLRQFYDSYGGEEYFAALTASPVLGHLNSGMQLYWLKHQRPALFEKIAHSLHLPQYMSFLLTNQYFSELTSIGCHTNLWDFSTGQYHEWVKKEGILAKLAPVVPSTHVVDTSLHNSQCPVGVGLHDSSAALIPYLASFHEPFILISTGTWCISLNPFDQSPLTANELGQDCLCYLTYHGKAVKAARIFAGNEHEQQVNRLAAHFGEAPDYYRSVRLDVHLLSQSTGSYQHEQRNGIAVTIKESFFSKRELSAFATYEQAYHQLMQDIVSQQIASTQLVLKGTGVKRIFVDGGFSKNPIYMHLLATHFHDMEVFAASMAQASAIGAALAVHSAWNGKHLPSDIIELKYYGITQDV